MDFNCLKIVLSIDSWVTVLDFFGVAGDEPDQQACSASLSKNSQQFMKVSTEIEIDSSL